MEDKLKVKQGMLFEIKEETFGLLNKFIVPPFSVLDTKQGYWQDRKRRWLKVTGNLSETRNGEFGTVGGGKKNGKLFGDFGENSGKQGLFNNINEGTSNFDPVLAEIIYRWFCPEGGRILDPFGGEQTKGVVAGFLGYPYTAVEFRQDQVDLNLEKTKRFKDIEYYCGDSNNLSKIIKDSGFDLCFTSPPYYDLEIYSKEDMSAVGTYEEFMAQYKNIFQQCYEKLSDNRFLVVKVGEIRNKKTGEYRNFVGDNITLMKEIGFKYYNEIILLNTIGTASIRAQNSMNNRKIVKIHQNVLVFFKGDIKQIGKIFKVEEED